MQVTRDLELLPELGGQNWSAVFLQKFEGTVTIWPKSRGALCARILIPRSTAHCCFLSHTVTDWFRLLTDPDRKELARMIRVGESVTYPKVRLRVLRPTVTFADGRPLADQDDRESAQD